MLTEGLRELQELVPGLPGADPLDRTVYSRSVSEGALHRLRPHPAGRGLHRPLARTPDPVLAHELVDRPAGGGTCLDAREREQLLAQGPQHERWRLAFAFQPVDDPQVARGVAAEQRLARGSST